MIRSLAPLLVILLAAAGAAGQQAPADLEALREAIEERRERVAGYENQERGLFDAIEAVDAAARALRAEVARAGLAAEEAEGAHSELAARGRAVARQVEATKRQVSRRAVALYKAGELGAVRLVFSAGSLQDRLARIQALQLLLDHDRVLLDRFASERAELAAARVAVDEAGVRRDAARERLAARSAQLEEERRAKRILLAQVRSERARERALLNELEAAARALEEKLADLRAEPVRPPGAAAFASQRGKLAPPVAGRVLRRFGRVVDAEYRTQTFRKGIDFAVELGEPVYAVAAGQVRFSDWFRGYGRMVILDHGDGYFTVSGHLDALKVQAGDAVSGGDAIGTAGDTGSLSGPLLYFEIRQGAEAQDPSRWLRLAPEL